MILGIFANLEFDFLKESMKNAILLYGRFDEKIGGVPIVNIPTCNPNNENNWMGGTKRELKKQGWRVTCPVIPEVWKAPYSVWETALDESEVDEDTVLVGLSQGAGAVIKYIIENKKKISKLILIAPARQASVDTPEFTEFYDFQITNDIKKQIKNGVTIFISNDDWPGILDAVKIYEEDLGAKVVRFEDRGHFSFLIKTFPELVEEICKVFF
mgnify:CR=1 FL=1